MLRIVVVVAGSLALAAGLFVAIVPLDDILNYILGPIPPQMYRCADLRDPSHQATRSEIDEAAKVGLRLPWSGPDGVPRFKPNTVGGVGRNGNDADNVMRGTDEDDNFFGAAGNDRMLGQKGLDTYVADIGHGEDLVEDASGESVLIFLAAVDIDAITVETGLPQGLRVRHSPSDTVTLDGVHSAAQSANWFVESSCGGEARPLATFEFVEAPPPKAEAE